MTKSPLRNFRTGHSNSSWSACKLAEHGEMGQKNLGTLLFWCGVQAALPSGAFSWNNNNNNNNNKQQTTNNKQQTTNNKQQTTNNKQQPTTNNQQPTTNNQQPTTNNQQPTTNNFNVINRNGKRPSNLMQMYGPFDSSTWKHLILPKPLSGKWQLRFHWKEWTPGKFVPYKSSTASFCLGHLLWIFTHGIRWARVPFSWPIKT